MCTHKTVKSLAKTEEKMKEINYYYPSPIEHLWVKAHGSMVVSMYIHVQCNDYSQLHYKKGANGFLTENSLV